MADALPFCPDSPRTRNFQRSFTRRRMNSCIKLNAARRPPRRYARQRPRPWPSWSGGPLDWWRIPHPPTTSSFIAATHPCWPNRWRSSSRLPVSFWPHWSRPLPRRQSLDYQGIVSPSQRVKVPVGPSGPSRASRTGSSAPSSTVPVPS